MLLSFFTEEAYDRLKSEISINEDRYANYDEWLDSYFSQSVYFKTSSVDINRFSPLYTPGKKSDVQKSQEDLVNARLIYKAFEKLNPLQATNKYMWTYLCHTEPEYRKYIVDRWFVDDPEEDKILKRFFVGDSKDSLFYNALARLWWCGYLTYDKDNSANPFALTEILFTNQTIFKDFIDTKNRSNPNRAKGVLQAIKEYKETRGEKGLIKCFRACNKYLNRYAATATLDFLEAEEIKQIALNFMNNWEEKK